MKKLFNLMAASLFLMAAVFAPKAGAEGIGDVDGDFWAKNEIYQMVNDGVMKLDAYGNFNPKASVKRAEFTSMLVKVLGQSSLDVYIENPFSDVNDGTVYYNDIMRSEQIGLVYGYPDGMFKPKNNMNKAEVTSAVSHITKDTVYDLSILDGFADAKQIPDWAKMAYAKTVKYNLFVNYPEQNKFEPDRDITRAETAVLLAKLKNAISNVKEQYKAEEVERTLSLEHLSIHSKAEANTVTITNMRKIIAEGNILKVSFAEKYNSKDSNVGDKVIFTNAKDVITDEGTLIIPAGSKFYATVEEIIEPQKFNKPASVKLNFDRLELPSGTSSQMNATVYNKLDGYLKDCSAAKVTASTIGGIAVGAGVASGVGIPLDEAGAAYAVGIPVGAVGGLAAGLITKGVNYKAGVGEEVYVKLNEALSVQEKTSL